MKISKISCRKLEILVNPIWKALNFLTNRIQWNKLIDTNKVGVISIFVAKVELGLRHFPFRLKYREFSFLFIVFKEASHLENQLNSYHILMGKINVFSENASLPRQISVTYNFKTFQCNTYEINYLLFMMSILCLFILSRFYQFRRKKSLLIISIGSHSF